MAMNSLLVFSLLLVLSHLHHANAYAIDYGQALTNSLLFFEAQRSGKLPSNQRVQWRGDSGLKDGSDANVDLTGGYYDAGDNVKFGFPMAFAMTTLSWGVVEFNDNLKSKNELDNALAAIRWGTDYLLRASDTDGVLYVEVGDGDTDHACWERPEDMTTPRTSYKISAGSPGADIVGETSAALAVASIAFKTADPVYSGELLDRARKLFDFANENKGLYSDSVPVAKSFYSSSGYNDELSWAAAWLHGATGEQKFLDQLSSSEKGGVRTMFSWDDKYLGVQTLVAKLILEGKVGRDGAWDEYKGMADQFLCNFIQKGSNNVKMSLRGMAWWNPWNDFQYTTSALLALVSYADSLAKANTNLACANGAASPDDLLHFALTQSNYILGENPEQMSYMIGHGNNYPQKVHHRGASIESIKKDSKPLGCKEGFDQWFNKDAPNPNVLVGAIVGGPDSNDQYTDSRSNFQQAEPALANTAPFVGVLLRVGVLKNP